MIKNISQIKEYLRWLLTNKIQIDCKKYTAYDHFFGDKCSIDSVDLVYIIFNVEEKYNIKFSENELMSDSLYSIKTLSEIIYQKIADL